MRTLDCFGSLTCSGIAVRTADPAVLKQIDAETPPELDLHLIVDNYATHKHAPGADRFTFRSSSCTAHGQSVVSVPSSVCRRWLARQWHPPGT